MEVQNKDKIAKIKNRGKFGFGSLKIRNKLIFGFFIVSIISGLANYYSNLFIVNEFRSVNNTMHMFHDIFAMQKKMEIMVENYTSSETRERFLDSDFDIIRKQIENKNEEFINTGGVFLEKDLMTRFIEECEVFFEKELDIVNVHKREIEARRIVLELELEEKEKRYVIRNFVNNLDNNVISPAFKDAEYVSKEMLYQYKDSEHMKEWLESLDKVREAATANSIEIPGFAEYYKIASNVSEYVLKVESIEQEEQKKMEDFRFSIESINSIQDEIFKAITDRNSKEINAIVVVGVFVFMFILIFFTVLFGYVISSFISRPIKELSRFALLVARGDFKSRISVNTDDEIGQTAKAFNLMLDAVEESTKVLEVKVNARTKIFEDLSRNLEAQINNKTKELNDKIFQLERFNDLSVGRELRMVELKRELEILKQGKKMEKKINKENLSSDDEDVKNCWDFWNCKKDVRDRCPAYLSGYGRECWIVSAGKCPRSKERGIENCKDCKWYKKMHNLK